MLSNRRGGAHKGNVLVGHKKSLNFTNVSFLKVHECINIDMLCLIIHSLFFGTEKSIEITLKFYFSLR